MTDSTSRVTRTSAAHHAGPAGWRYGDECLVTAVPVNSFGQAAQVAAQLADVAGEQADEHLRIDVRPGCLVLRVASAVTGELTHASLALIDTLTAQVRELGLVTSPTAVPRAVGGAGQTRRAAVQRLQIAIDALDIPAVRPFWEAVLGYVTNPGYPGPEGDLVDPFGIGPMVWFQQMDAPRPQRNRIHFDVLVGEDEAEPRIEAALAAGGHLVNDTEAPAFWVLADVEGNEVCVCTWQGRND